MMFADLFIIIFVFILGVLNYNQNTLFIISLKGGFVTNDL